MQEIEDLLKSATETKKCEKTLEEFNLEMLAQLTASVRPARHVPNLAALEWVLDQLNSSMPPTELDMEWFSIGCPQVSRSQCF
jgi:hypothetical protein